MKTTPRRRSREIALQALYAWQIARDETSHVLAQARELDGYERCDAALVESLVRGVIARIDELKAWIAPHLSERRLESLSPVEAAILYIATFELAAHPETPLKVVLNEAIDLGKSFGGTAGYRFVNGVLERVAQTLRPDELARARQTA